MTAEPVGWQIQATDTIFQNRTGSVGFRSLRHSGNSNSSVTIRYDNVRVEWPAKLQTLPGNGGPFAINIGPFMQPSGLPPENSMHEIEILQGSGKGYSYKFTFNPRSLMEKNPTDGLYDRWFRVIPDQVNEDNILSNISQTVKHYTFDDIEGWEPLQDTSIINELSLQGDNAYLKIVSSTGVAPTIGATSGVGEFLHQVMPNAAYDIIATITSSTQWDSGVEFIARWYSDKDTFLSEDPGGIIELSPNLPTEYATSLVAPEGANWLELRFIVYGTPSTNDVFFIDDVQIRTADSITRTDFSLDVALRKTEHGPTSSSESSGGELWIRIYLHWLNSVTRETWIVKYRNTGGWTQAKSFKTKKPVYEYIINPPDAVGYLGYHDAGGIYTTRTNGFPSFLHGIHSSGPWRNPDLLVYDRAQKVLSGGGVITWDGLYLKWSAPFEIGGIGRSRNGFNTSFARLDCPTSGVIPVIPMGGSSLPDANGIPLVPGQTLWFGIPPGLDSFSIPNIPEPYNGLHGTGGLFIVDNDSLELWSPPEWAVLIAYCLNDDSQPEIKLGNGQTLDKWRTPTFQNSWTDAGAPYAPVGYTMIDGGLVRLRGTVTSGTIGNAIFTLPPGYRPAGRLVFMVMSNGSPAQCEVNSDGTVIAASGSSTSFSLDGVSFKADQ